MKELHLALIGGLNMMACWNYFQLLNNKQVITCISMCACRTLN